MIPTRCTGCGQGLELERGQSVLCWRCNMPVPAPGLPPPPPPPPAAPVAPTYKHPFEDDAEAASPGLRGLRRAVPARLPSGVPAELLGRPLGEYTPNWWLRLFIFRSLLGPFLIVLLCLVYWFFAAPPNHPQLQSARIGLCIAAASLGLGLVLLATVPSRRFIACKDGLVDAGPFHAHFVLWREVHALRQIPVPIYYKGHFLRFEYRLEISLAHGVRGMTVAAEALEESASLARHAQRAVGEALLPAAVERLRSGGRVPLGVLSAVADGLEEDGRLVPWGQVRDIEVTGETVKIHGSRRGVGVHLPIAEVVNLGLLLRLLEWARGGGA